MANVLHPTINFQPRQVSHAPSPFGFGFGLNSASSSSMSSPAWGSATPGHTNSAAFHQLASSITQSASTSKAQKRRHEAEDELENSRYPVPDESMDRSPTPETQRVKKPLKKARITNTGNATSKDDAHSKGSKNCEDDDSVDIGVLLASLPQQSLLPILSGLLKMQPNLKSVILPLIPRPSVQDAIEAITQAKKKLQDAYPFSNPTSAFSTHHSFGIPQQPTMRNDYVLSRLRPHIAEFVSTCQSYFPYFSYKYPTSSSSSKQPFTASHSPTSTIQREKFYPAESFEFLSTVTRFVIDQPSLVLSELEPLILPRLSEEWKTWVENLDRHANREGNMVAPTLARSWEVSIETLIDGKAASISSLMRDVQMHFPVKQGWGFSARPPQMMFGA